MPYYLSQSIAERLNHADEIINTVTIDESLRIRLEEAGYSAERFNEVQELLTKARRLETNQQVQVGKQTAATNALEAQTTLLRLKFVSDRKFARHVLKNDRPLQEEIRLHIKTKRKREALILQMTHFYEEVVKYENLMAGLLSEFNLTPDLFSTRLDEVAALVTAIQTQQYQIGQVRVATRERRDAMEALDEWMSAFIGMARQALRDEKETLKKLMIFTQPLNKADDDDKEKTEGSDEASEEASGEAPDESPGPDS